MSSINIKTIDTLDKKEFDKLIKELCDIYYNASDKEPISDLVYDSIIDVYTRKFGKYKNVGAPVNAKNREKLPKYLGSLDKVRTKPELTRWTGKYKGPYVLTDKIDGIAALYNGSKMWTRGDGNIGTNISHILPYLKLPVFSGGYVRGEIYMPKSIFLEKYNNEFSNTRNMVAGLLNPLTKTPNVEAIKDLSFIAYEFDDETYTQSQSQQLDTIESLGFRIPYNEVVVDDLTIEHLDNLIRKRKLDADYDMDGLVIVNDVAVKCVSRDNPDNAIAFKIEGDVVITEVERVEWNASKHKVLKPRVKVKPVNLCGVEINWATGFNAKFIRDNKIGPGANVKITRSGDVIPYILEVVKMADREDMPDEEYEWNETEVDIVLLTETEDVKIRKIVEFFKTLDAKFVGKSTIEKLYNNGFDTLKKIFNATVDDLTDIEGIQQKSAHRIVDAIKSSITGVSVAKLAAASGCLGVGIGERKIQSILDVHPNILDYNITNDKMIDKIKEIDGFQKKTASKFAINLPKFVDFIKEHPMIQLENPKKKVVEIVFEDEEDDKPSLRGKTIVFSGVRDKDIENIITTAGGKVTTSVSKKTSVLVVAKRYSASSKELNAEKLGIEILTLEEFKNLYL